MNNTMLNPQQALLVAGQKMLGKNKVNQNDARRVVAVAEEWQQGKASKRDIAWAKTQAKFFMPRHA